uniref:14-3-3 protein zeta (Trinotate prediction) n=1 Tax=Henneguya salminicola TaxID=69463 RepID=A0A6G3MGY4_HENSL
MSKTKDDLTTLVILAERAERYSDMFNYMLDLIKLGGELSEEDRNLLSVACKNTIGPKRSSIRCLAMLEEKHAKDSLKLECVKELREIVVSEMAKVCNTLVEILTAHVLAKASSPADNVFYQKMVGDYYRYLAEALKGDARSEASAKALDVYL